MKILHYIHYMYLAVAAMFVFDAVEKLRNDENAIVSFLFAAAAIFLFFFRRHFSGKIKNNNK